MNYEKWIVQKTKHFRDNGVALYMPFPSKRLTDFVSSMKHRERMIERKNQVKVENKPMTRQERVEVLHTWTTYELMRYRRSCYKCSGYYSDYWEYNSNEGYNLDEVLEVLNTREHVPNKKEKKRLRREAAKRKT